VARADRVVDDSRPSAAPSRGTAWIVVLAYVVASAALALAIYERFLT